MKIKFPLAAFALITAVRLAPGQTKPFFDCYHIKETVTVDGKLTEVCWKQAVPMKFHVVVTLADPTTTTTGRICWDDSNLYVAFDARDLDLKGTQTARDSSVYLDDALETFFQPGTYSAGYHNFEINILGTVYDSQSVQGSGWNCTGLRLAIQRNGTLNQSSDVDSSWQMEIAIPFSSLVGLGKARPDPGDVWPFHLARYDYSAYLPSSPELSSCAFLTQRKFHNRAEWIELHFKGDQSAARNGIVVK